MKEVQIRREEGKNDAGHQDMLGPDCPCGKMVVSDILGCTGNVARLRGWILPFLLHSGKAKRWELTKCTNKRQLFSSDTVPKQKLLFHCKSDFYISTISNICLLHLAVI